MQFNRTKSVSLPQIKLVLDTSYFLKITGAMVTKPGIRQAGDDKDPQPMTLVNVVDLKTNVEQQLICGEVLKKELQGNYPNDGYVGKAFEIIQRKVDGKRYKGFEIYEIEVPEEKPNGKKK